MNVPPQVSQEPAAPVSEAVTSPVEEAPKMPTEEEIAECMTACLQQNQMRAVAYAIIEADCTTSCTGTLETLGTQPLPGGLE